MHGFQNAVPWFQYIFAGLNSTIEILDKGTKMFKVKNKDKKTTSLS